MNAHNLGELRILSAIQINSLDPGFKTQRCKDYDDFKECPKGMAELLLSQRSFWLAESIGVSQKVSSSRPHNAL